jgi:hypothetical protein
MVGFLKDFVPLDVLRCQSHWFVEKADYIFVILLDANI